MQTMRLCALQPPSRVQMLLQSLLQSLLQARGPRPIGAWPVIDRGELPCALQRMIVKSQNTGRVWNAWTESRAMVRTSQSGITLIELMVTVAIVAILAGIAYPSYQSQVRKSRRAAAQAFLMDVAARQLQRMVDVRSYATAFGVGGLNMTLPSELNGFYTVTVAADNVPPGIGFTLTATPIGAQVNDSACNPLTLDQAGAKIPAACW